MMNKLQYSIELNRVQFFYKTELKTLQDESAHATKEEILNGFPEMLLILNPGGCSHYQFPIKSGQENFFLTPGRKEGDVNKKNFTFIVKTTKKCFQMHDVMIFVLKT